jgi:hypothetical protein
MTSLQPGTVPAKGLPPGTSWFIDNSLPDNYLYYYDKRGIWFLQGPSRTSNYRDEIPGAAGVLFRDWHNAFVYQSGFGKKMTGIAP